MKILFLLAVASIVIGVFTYDKWSYNQWYERCKINAKHPNWTTFCGINFLKKDPKWFIENGYGKWVQR